MIIKAIRHYAISILIYTLMHPFIESVYENYGLYSIQHWIIVFLSFVIGTIVMYLVIKIEEY